ncbi:hypothetical protein MA16_Dca019640 [Dendrobium catenatum]|uniref:Uncharacterized protein n=1 Tax=Dendrobium catenatum TaxID=906689 RepID=A0A2I0V943_9ASPA|nr:hypothetical protein MA16_Dca019640 [Dendrobium catenatum]
MTVGGRAMVKEELIGKRDFRFIFLISLLSLPCSLASSFLPYLHVKNDGLFIVFWECHGHPYHEEGLIEEVAKNPPGAHLARYAARCATLNRVATMINFDMWLKSLQSEKMAKNLKVINLWQTAFKKREKWVGVGGYDIPKVTIGEPGVPANFVAPVEIGVECVEACLVNCVQLDSVVDLVGEAPSPHFPWVSLSEPDTVDCGISLKPTVSCASRYVTDWLHCSSEYESDSASSSESFGDAVPGNDLALLCDRPVVFVASLGPARGRGRQGNDVAGARSFVDGSWQPLVMVSCSVGWLVVWVGCFAFIFTKLDVHAASTSLRKDVGFKENDGGEVGADDGTVDFVSCVGNGVVDLRRGSSERLRNTNFSWLMQKGKRYVFSSARVFARLRPASAFLYDSVVFMAKKNFRISSIRGMPALWFSEDEFLHLAKPFEFALVGKFPLKRPAFDSIRVLNYDIDINVVEVDALPTIEFLVNSPDALGTPVPLIVSVGLGGSVSTDIDVGVIVDPGLISSGVNVSNVVAVGSVVAVNNVSVNSTIDVKMAVQPAVNVVTNVESERVTFANRLGDNSGFDIMNHVDWLHGSSEFEYESDFSDCGLESPEFCGGSDLGNEFTLIRDRHVCSVASRGRFRGRGRRRR